MTPRRGEAGRGPGASHEWAPAPPGAIFPALLTGALLLRLIIAYVLFPGSGFEVDIGSFQSWAVTLARYGPGGFYENAGFADYTPGYLYVLWPVGIVAQALGDLSGAGPFAYTASLIKLPAILSDVALGYLVYRTLQSWSGERAALIGAALVLYNPVTWYESALWGQVDAFGVIVLLGAVLLLLAGWSEAATGAAVVAALIKPQYGIVLFVVGFVLLRRHLLHPGSGPVPAIRHRLPERLNEALGGWFTVEQGAWRLVSSAATGMAVLFLLITPFDLAELAAAKAPGLPIGGDLGGLLAVVGQAAGEYHFLTVNAYNLWALVGPTSLASAGVWTNDLDPAIGAIPYLAIGALLLAVTLGFFAYQFLRRDDRASIVVTATVLAVAFFVVPTRVHERYLFPAFALGALLAGGSPAWRWWYVALALVNVANLHANLTNPLYGTPNVVDLPFGAALRSEGMVALIAIAHTALFGWALWHVRPALDDLLAWPGALLSRRRAAGASTTTPRMAWRTPWAQVGPEQPPAPAETEPNRAEPPAPAAVEAPARAGPDRWEESAEPPRWFAALRRRLMLPSIRPDRSRLLHGEGAGRVDRLDLLALVLIVVLGLALRLFRADQPFSMVTLDEVYHARTGTEFLQDWRYGIPHSIYEYTHPHLAKYLMAVGIATVGDNRVVGTGNLGTPVRSLAVEERHESPGDAAGRAGDRLFVATGTSVRVIDLRTGADEAAVPVLAISVALDPAAHRLYAASVGGVIWSLETSTLDRLRDGEADPADLVPVEVGRVGAAVERIWPVAPDRLVVEAGGRLTAFDPTTGERPASRLMVGLGGAIRLDAVATVVAFPGSMERVGATAGRLAGLLDLDAAEIETSLAGPAAASPGGVRIISYLSPDVRAAVQDEIDAGRLGGVEVVDRVPLAIAGDAGVTVIDGTSLDTIGEVTLGARGSGLALVGEGGERVVYVAAGDGAIHVLALNDDGPPTESARLQMPGPVRDVRWNRATNLVHVLGATSAGEPTLYVIEPHGRAVFADAVLPFAPSAWALDVQSESPAGDREEALLFAADGSSAAVDLGRNAFAWRLPGIVLGVLMAAALYLLARFLFRRRAVALIAGAAALTDGMLFAHSRDAMNDAYVGSFIVAAFAVLAWLALPPSGRRGPLAVALGLPLVGVLLGLALAAKWAAVFAIGAALLIVLLRSALGRLAALAAMIVLAGFLGNLAVASGNLTFALLAVGVVLAMAAGIVWRPLAFSREELRYALVAPLVVGVLLAVVAAAGITPGGELTVAGARLPLLTVAAVALAAGAILLWLTLREAGRRGWIAIGATDGGPGEPARPPRGWLRPGAAWGLPFTYAMVCLAVVPLAVYVLSYVPWARPWDPACLAPGNDCPQIVPATIGPAGVTLSEGWPPGHRGQTLPDLTVAMYDYHDNLRATHPATSPWWAWPFNLKPVWLFQESLGAGTTGAIFDMGNLVTFWLSVPAIGFGLWQAWRRRSLALAFVAVAFLAQWLSWARIDRATFQYHYYTALPFAFLFLGYFLAELWQGPSRRTWQLARVGAAVALLGPGLLWLVKDPLCTFAGVTAMDPNSYLCTGTSGSLSVPWAVVATGALLLVGILLFVRELLRLGSSERARTAAVGGEAPSVPRETLVRLAAIAVASGLGVTAAPAIVGQGTFTFSGSLGQAWAVGLAYLVGAGAFAWLVLGARDPRRYVAVALLAAGAWLVVFYPYIADLPLPGGAVYAYQRLLPTFDYSFQFAVNTEAAPAVGFLDPQGAILAFAIGLLAAVTMMLAGQWRTDRTAAPAPDGREAART